MSYGIRIAAVLLGMGAALASPARAQRSVDVHRGEFYTEQEYRTLAKAEAQAYCNALADELASRQNEATTSGSTLSRERSQVNDLKNRMRSLDSELSMLESQVGSLESQIKELQALPATHKVAKGESLWRISGKKEIYSDPAKWTRLYRANRDILEDPDVIHPNQVLKVARGLPPRHEVVEGDFLSRIAGYWEVYDDWTQWTKIYEANKDKIRDPDLIYPDQNLVLPR